MKQKFSKEEHKKFQELFNIQKNPTLVNTSFVERTKNYIKYIKWIPGLKMVGIGNSVSMNSNNENSDIDLFIVTEENRIWFVRILVTIIFQILMVRKTKNKHKEKFCLSFFTTINGIDFSSFALENDIYLYFWIIYMRPILDYDNTYENFIEKNSSWANFSEYEKIIEKNKSYIFYKNTPPPNPLPSRSGNLKNIFSSPPPARGELEGGKIVRLSEKVGDYFNIIFKKIFLQRTLNHNISIGKPFGIIINDEILKFHDNDVRKKVKKELGF